MPAITEPVFVSAREAEIPDDAWVLGVEYQGVTRAYSLWLLNGHEIVNDHFADLPVAVIW